MNMQISDIGRITTEEAAAVLNTSAQFVRVGMQQEKLPIGTAVKLSPNKWTYHISEKLLGEYTGKDVDGIVRNFRARRSLANEKEN